MIFFRNPDPEPAKNFGSDRIRNHKTAIYNNDHDRIKTPRFILQISAPSSLIRYDIYMEPTNDIGYGTGTNTMREVLTCRLPLQGWPSEGGNLPGNP